MGIVGSCCLAQRHYIGVRKPVDAGNVVVVGAERRHDRAVRVRTSAVPVPMGEIGLCVGIFAVVVAPASSMSGTNTAPLEAIQQAVSNKTRRKYLVVSRGPSPFE